jgi:maltose alpha-D-glucosyltransferase/alpha-amylase
MPNLHPNRDGLDPDPDWYKTGVIYELHVRAYCDSNADGTGDFPGLTQKLDYLKALGVTALWLLPFYPSPLKDDGYDVADYCDVHPLYGTLGDFKNFLREAHGRGLRVITELVLNHTSDQHPWFQRARSAPPGSRWRDYYVWSATSDKYRGTRVIFKDAETSNWTWDPVAKAYFWHRFFSHQPDLNYDNSRVHQEIFRVVDFWLELGVDGLRLDAAPYLYEREGTGCENLAETHAFLRKLRAHVDEKYHDRVLLAEANQWPADAAAYFGAGRGDECHMAFHFPLMTRLFLAVRLEERQPIVDILEQTPVAPETSQWALFLRNHDDLTLETVTDEERDYLYRMYAHMHQAQQRAGVCRRLAPLLGNDRRRIELLNGLLFSLPGTPVLYYGDEIGMGENVYLGDRNGVRTPMQWNPDKNAGFSRAAPQSLYLPIILDPGYHYEANNVDTQLANPHSLLRWMRRLLALRKRWRALGQGKCEFIQPDNRKVLSYLLRYEQETILVVANLSRFAQSVELDLAPLRFSVPIELFGRAEFPAITDQPYFLTLGPHAFYWFSLEPQAARLRAPAASEPGGRSRRLSVPGPWREILSDRAKADLEAVLPGYLHSQRWFGRPADTIKSALLKEVLPVPLDAGEVAFLALLQVDSVDTGSQIYALPLAFKSSPGAEKLHDSRPHAAIAELSVAGESKNGLLYDALADPAFCRALLRLVSNRSVLRGLHGKTEAFATPGLRGIAGDLTATKSIPRLLNQEDSSVVYGDKLILKLFRRLEEGPNPDTEIGQFLTAKEFPNAPRLAGTLEYSPTNGASITLALVNQFIPNAKRAWEYTLDALSRYYDRVTTWIDQDRPAPPATAGLLSLWHQQIPPDASNAIGTYLESARLLGTRTAEFHLALASEPENRDFAPESFTPHYQRALFQAMRGLAVENLRQVRQQMKILPAEILPLAQRVAELEPAIVECYQQFSQNRFSAKRIRIHADCHLGRVLWTGKDFVFINFEGDPSLALSERRIKRSPLRDVVRMVRSFHAAAHAGLHQHGERGSIPQDLQPKFEPWAWYWQLWVSVAFLQAYVQRTAGSGLLPVDNIVQQRMLRAYLLHQMVGELGNDLNGGGERLGIALSGILALTGEQAAERIRKTELETEANHRA